MRPFGVDCTFLDEGAPPPTNDISQCAGESLTKLNAVGSTPIRDSEEIRRLTSPDHTAYALAMDGTCRLVVVPTSHPNVRSIIGRRDWLMA